MAPAVRRQIALWLFLCCSMVFAILVVGGITRLTHSGLSMVEWKPLVGIIPPLNEAEWQETFGKYKQSPEYKTMNGGMSLEAFKGIFFWEYWHRVLGRLMGIAFLLPYLYFLIRHRIDRPLKLKLLAIFLLGGLQGAMGWYMVKSGLIDNPRVSQYRLTAHLSIAFLIFTAMFWVALGLWRSRATPTANAPRGGLHKAGFWFCLLVFYMVISGGFVAGTRAGKVYNTFPLMNGALAPPELFVLEPWYLNFVENISTIQFDHRLGAWALAFLLPWFWWRIRRAAVSPAAHLASNLLLAALAVQLTLGIATLLLRVPIALGAAHQGGAMVVFGLLLWLNHELRVPASLRQ